MKFPKLLTVGLLSLGTIVISALPSMARPGYIYSEANVRSAPSVNARRIDGLPTGTPLEILRVDSGRDSRGWYYVRSTGQLRTEGWVSSALVNFEQDGRQYGTLRGSDGDVINIRSEHNTGSRIKHTGMAGDLVEVGESRVGRSMRQSESGYTWYQVTYPNGASGWVRSDLISVWEGP
jgi:SH3-like domain-containing protein